MQNSKRVGDQLGREEGEADRISQAVKTHMNESLAFKKKKRKENALLIWMLLCDLSHTSSLLERAN